MFEGVRAAQIQAASWREDDNHHQPHSVLGYETPVEFATRCRDLQSSAAGCGHLQVVFAPYRMCRIASSPGRFVMSHRQAWSVFLGRRFDHSSRESEVLVVDLALPFGARIVERDRDSSISGPEIRTGVHFRTRPRAGHREHVRRAVD
jgi:hypothetical protein